MGINTLIKKANFVDGVLSVFVFLLLTGSFTFFRLKTSDTE